MTVRASYVKIMLKTFGFLHTHSRKSIHTWILDYMDTLIHPILCRYVIKTPALYLLPL